MERICREPCLVTKKFEQRVVQITGVGSCAQSLGNLSFQALGFNQQLGQGIGIFREAAEKLSNNARCSAVVCVNSTPIPWSGCITRTTPSDRNSTPAARIESVTRVETGKGEGIPDSSRANSSP